MFHNTKIPQVRDVIGLRLITESHDLKKAFQIMTNLLINVDVYLTTQKNKTFV